MSLNRLWFNQLGLTHSDPLRLDNGFCVFAFGSAQNDRMGSIMLRMKVFKLENLTKGILVL